MTTPLEVVRRIAGDRGARAGEGACAYAPANIALVKYWGKRDEALNLPVTGSLSISLGPLGSHVELAQADGPGDAVWLNGAPLAVGSPFARRASAYLDLFRPSPAFCFELKARNTVPTAAGFASSASGFAALAKAVDGLFDWGLSVRELSILARLGSGSAARSLEDGFVEWAAGTDADGMDSHARRIDAEWPELRVGAVVVSAAEKPVGSREGMRRSVETCEFYREWPARVSRDLAAVKDGIARRDVEALGSVAEANALAMHALMLATRPPILYALPETVTAMRRIWSARADGVPLWFTMDAGPNVKLLYEARVEPQVRELFPEMQAVDPFAPR
jgi:diphosphomevalonate decarboxylase